MYVLCHYFRGQRKVGSQGGLYQTEVQLLLQKLKFKTGALLPSPIECPLRD